MRCPSPSPSGKGTKEIRPLSLRVLEKVLLESTMCQVPYLPFPNSQHIYRLNFTLLSYADSTVSYSFLYVQMYHKNENTVGVPQYLSKIGECFKNYTTKIETKKKSKSFLVMGKKQLLDEIYRIKYIYI